MYQVQNRTYLIEFHIICYKKAQLTEKKLITEKNFKFLPKFLTLQKCEEIKKIIHHYS